MGRVNQHGFTLPELLVVSIFFIALIVASLFIIYPKNYDPIDRNAQRLTDIAQIMQSVDAYERQNRVMPPGITSSAQEIGSYSGEIDLCKSLSPQFLKSMPIDPDIGSTQSCSSGSDYITGFLIKSVSGGHVTITAAAAEDKVDIKLTN